MPAALLPTGTGAGINYLWYKLSGLYFKALEKVYRQKRDLVKTAYGPNFTAQILKVIFIHFIMQRLVLKKL